VIVYGRNPVREAIRGPREVVRLWATKNACREGWLRALSDALVIVSAEEIGRLAGTAAHQGVCAEVEPYRYVDADRALGVDGGLIVALDQLQDPQNLGSICRTAECAGAAAVVIPERRAAEVTPAVCKASAGAVEHLAICQVRNMADFLAEAKATGAWCYGADADGRVSYDQVDYTGQVVLVLGSEGRGLRPRVAAACDELVSIPMAGRTESLNVSAAAAVLIYAAAGARG
jgi:23S rRNA (guanosine2251-2'-O)-methyltransferase